MTTHSQPTNEVCVPANSSSLFFLNLEFFLQPIAGVLCGFVSLLSECGSASAHCLLLLVSLLSVLLLQVYDVGWCQRPIKLFVERDAWCPLLHLCFRCVAIALHACNNRSDMAQKKTG